MRLVSSNPTSPANQKYGRLSPVGVAGNALTFDVDIDSAQEFTIRPGDCNLVSFGLSPVEIAMIDARGGAAAQLFYPSETAATAEFPDGMWTRDICTVSTGNLLQCNVAGRSVLQVERETVRLTIGSVLSPTADSVTIFLEQQFIT